MFIEVTSKRRDGIIVQHLIAIDDIAGITTAPSKGVAIITLKVSDYQIWTNETYDQVISLVLKAGVQIAKVKTNPKKESK